MKPGLVTLACAWAMMAAGCGAGGGAVHPDTAAGPDSARSDITPMDGPSEAGVLDASDAMADTGFRPFPALPLRTEGRFVVDDEGRRVRLMGVNWNGAHEDVSVPYGLDIHPPAAIAARLAAMGLNSVRLTWSNELVETDPVPDPAAVAGWPEAAGLTAVEVLVGVAAALGDAGILVVLNNHMSDTGWCCSDEDGNGLWYNERYPEEAWIADWVELAERTGGNPMVVAADLRNEPRQGAVWRADADPAFDWPSAAERCAEAVLAVRPDWLIIVEGVGYAADLTGVKERPIELSIPNRLVYSVHDYPWFTPNLLPTPELYAQQADNLWGYLLEPPYEVPVLVGEFGTCNTCWNEPWVGKFTQYTVDRDLDWSLWPIFGSADGWGLLSAETLEVNSPDLPALLEAWGL